MSRCCGRSDPGGAAQGVDRALIKARISTRKAKLFGAGTLDHLILGVVREGELAMTMEEIVKGVVAEAGWDGADPAAARGMKPRVWLGLLYLTSVQGLTVEEGERTGAAWRLSA